MIATSSSLTPFLVSLKEKFKVDTKRIYSTGHSNGGGFTYLLWETRGDVFAAMAPSAAFTRNAAKLKPLPAMHLAGERSAGQVRVADEMHGSGAEGQQLRRGGTSWDKLCTQYPSKTGTPFVAFIHPGTHTYPKEGPALIVKFFKEHEKK